MADETPVNAEGKDSDVHYCANCLKPFACDRKNLGVCFCVQRWGATTLGYITYHYCGFKCSSAYLIDEGYATQEEEESDVSGKESSGEESGGDEEADSRREGAGNEAPK
jgi:hypothetical protein